MYLYTLACTSIRTPQAHAHACMHALLGSVIGAVSWRDMEFSVDLMVEEKGLYASVHACMCCACAPVNGYACAFVCVCACVCVSVCL